MEILRSIPISAHNLLNFFGNNKIDLYLTGTDIKLEIKSDIIREDVTGEELN